jgi:MFS family permease
MRFGDPAGESWSAGNPSAMLPSGVDVRPTPTLRWLLLLSLAEIATMVTFSNYTAAQPLLAQQWRLSSAEAGAIFGAQQAGYALAVLWLASLTDLVGVRRIYLLSAAWNGFAAALFAVGARGFLSALLLRALLGVGLAGTYMPGVRLVAETFPQRKRGAALGVFIACFSVGAALSLFLAGRLLVLGVRTMFLLTAAGPLLGVLLAWPVVRDGPRPMAGARRRGLPFRDVLRNPPALRYIAGYTAHNWELFGMRAWLPVFLTAAWSAQGASLPEATRMGTAVGSAVLLAGAASNAAGGWLSDRAGRMRTIVTFLSASALCSAVIGWLLPVGLGAVIAVALLYGIFTTAESSTLSTAVAESAFPHALGTTMAVQSTVGFVATIVSPVLFGALLDAYGWGWAFVSLAVAAAAGVLTLLTGGAPVSGVRLD